MTCNCKNTECLDWLLNPSLNDYFKVVRQIDGKEFRLNFRSLANLLDLQTNGEGGTSIAPWDDSIAYTEGDIVIDYANPLRNIYYASANNTNTPPSTPGGPWVLLSETNHVRNRDLGLDEGGANAVTALRLREISDNFPNTTLTAGVYGSSTQIPVITINNRGFITAITNIPFTVNRIVSLNGLTAENQTFFIGTAGNDFSIVSLGSNHTFNIPTANSTNRGLLTSADWNIFTNKLGPNDRRNLTIGAGFNGNDIGDVDVFNNVLVTDNVSLTLNVHGASTTGDVVGLITAADYTSFQNKIDSLLRRSISVSGTGMSINGGSSVADAVLGNNVTVSITNATSSSGGLLTSADWNTFNNKQSLTVASNGIRDAGTLISPNFRLGGALIENTIIDLGTNSFNINYNTITQGLRFNGNNYVLPTVTPTTDDFSSTLYLTTSTLLNGATVNILKSSFILENRVNFNASAGQRLIGANIVLLSTNSGTNAPLFSTDHSSVATGIYRKAQLASDYLFLYEAGNTTGAAYPLILASLGLMGVTNTPQISDPAINPTFSPLNGGASTRFASPVFVYSAVQSGLSFVSANTFGFVSIKHATNAFNFRGLGTELYISSEGSYFVQQNNLNHSITLFSIFNVAASTTSSPHQIRFGYGGRSTVGSVDSAEGFDFSFRGSLTRGDTTQNHRTVFRISDAAKSVSNAALFSVTHRNWMLLGNIVPPTSGSSPLNVFAMENASSAPTSIANTALLYSLSGNLRILNSAGNVINLTPISGWGTPTGTISRATFATGTVTTSDLAQRVAQLIIDLQSVGILIP